jgi:hypothetical protein
MVADGGDEEDEAGERRDRADDHEGGHRALALM